MNGQTVVVTKPKQPNRGFFSLVIQAISNIYDLRHQYSLFYFDYSDNTFYKDESRGEVNFFNYYFEQDKQLLEYDKVYINFVSPWYQRRDQWHVMTGDFREEISAIAHRYLKIRRAVLERVSSIHRERFQGKKVLAIHKRGTDHGMHGEMLSLNEYFAAVDANIRDYDALYLATDEVETVEKFHARYKEKLIWLDDVFRSADGKAVHWYNSTDNYKKGEDVLVEALLLSKADKLIRTMSNITLFSIVYNPKLPYERIDSHIQYH